MTADMAARTEPDSPLSDIDREAPVLHYRLFNFRRFHCFLGHTLYRQ